MLPTASHLPMKTPHWDCLVSQFYQLQKSNLYLLEWGVARFFDVLGFSNWLANAHPFIQQVGLVQIARTTAAVLMVLVMLSVLHGCISATVRTFERK